MNDSENKISESSTERKEMKGPSFSFDPKLFLNNSMPSDMSMNLASKNEEKTNVQQEEKNIPIQEKQPEREMTAREKLRQKLQMKKMMRHDKGTLKRMFDSKIKS
tara:strand:+ start:5 stop:319 length:315 start_codon:yes stop_codon:yes gene_type:complete